MVDDKLKYENYYYDKGYERICGVDEAGRGPLAGPVCAAAVILPRGLVIEQVNDSKKLSEKKREMLFDIIKEKAEAYNIAWATVEEIESMNILNATMLAMRRAVEGLAVSADFALIDGNRRPVLDIPCVDIVKGDSLSESIAAASILAKVSRDRLMLELAKKYPDYGFEKHKGYGSELHRNMIREHGPCEIHRLSFLSGILNPGQKKPRTAKQRQGDRGEAAAVDYLAKKGLPFRDAYKATGEIVAKCIESGLTLETLPIEEYKKICDVFDEGVYEAIGLEKCAFERSSRGGPCPDNVKKQVERVSAILDSKCYI